jgi:SAM-dependent methyltransferase
MSTDYNKIAKEYQASKILPWRLYAEAYTYFKNMDEVSGLSILDLACGDGFYTRQLKLRGALEVIGVDLSQAMVAMAQGIEDENPLGLRYVVRDAKRLELGQKFDQICASYLLNYAKNKDELCQMVTSIGDHLKRGGVFTTINSNPDFRADKGSMRHYGFTRENESFNEGSEIVYRFYQEDESFIEVTNYHLERATHEEVLKQFGFSNIEWHRLEVSKEGEEKFKTAYWENLKMYQPIVGLSCTKR